MKYNLTEILESEKNRILKLHENEKKRLINLINEQTGGDAEILKKARELNCKIAKNGVLKSAPGQPIALVKKADYDSSNGYFKIGDELFVYGNYTFDVVKRNPDGSIISVSENNPWACSALKTSLESVQSELQANTPEALDIKNLIGAGWETIDSLRKKRKTPDEIETLYQKHPNYPLYKYKGDPNRIAGYTDEQNEFITAWTADPEVADNIKRQVYKINPTAKDFATGDWKLDTFFIAPNSDKFFQGGLKVYFNLSKKPEPTRSTCKSMIKDFADKYKRKDSNPPTAQYINYTRGFIQDCVNKYKFGGPLSGLNDELKLLGGVTTGGAGRRSPWHIQLPE